MNAFSGQLRFCAEREKMHKDSLNNRAADEIDRLEREMSEMKARFVAAVSPDELGRLLVKHSLVQEAAISDPEGYDEWQTSSAIIDLSDCIVSKWKRLIEDRNRLRSEIDNPHEKNEREC